MIGPSAPNYACIGGVNSTVPGNGTIDTQDIPSSLRVDCTEEYGDSFCYTMVTWNPPFDRSNDQIQDKVPHYTTASIAIDR